MLKKIVDLFSFDMVTYMYDLLTFPGDCSNHGDHNNVHQPITE